MPLVLTDEPMTRLKRAIWWTEYVIRHKGAKHFKSPWAPILLVDVTAFVVTCFVVAVTLVYEVLTFVFKVVYHIKTKYKYL